MGWRDAPLVSPSPSPSPSARPIPAASGWRSAPIVQPVAAETEPEARIPAGVDPRMEPEHAFGYDEVAGDTASGLTTAALAAGAGPGGTVGKALSFAADPRVGAAYAGGKKLLESGDPIEAAKSAGLTYVGQKAAGKALGKVIGTVGGWMSKSLSARMAHQVVRAAAAEAAPAAQALAAEVAPAARAAAAEAAPAAKAFTAEMETLLKRATDATAPPRVRLAARAALEKAGWTREMGVMAEPIVEAAPAAAPVAESTIFKGGALRPTTMPVKGNVKPATVYTRPAGAPPTRSAAPTTLQRTAAESLKARQLEAAREAGVDVGEAFGTAPVAVKAEQAAESALETRLRASVLMKKDPLALANEIADHVASLGKVKPERAAEAVQELYGIPATNARQMVEMVFQAQGWR